MVEVTEELKRWREVADAIDEVGRLATDEIVRLREQNEKLRKGECLGTVPPTDVPCQRDSYCSKLCQEHDGDGSRGERERETSIDTIQLLAVTLIKVVKFSGQAYDSLGTILESDFAAELVAMPTRRVNFEAPPGVKEFSNVYPHVLCFSRLEDASDAIKRLSFAWRPR